MKRIAAMLAAGLAAILFATSAFAVTQPTGFALSAGLVAHTQVNVEWDALDSLSRVNSDSVSIRNAADSSFVALFDTTVTSGTLSLLTPNTQYILCVSVDSSGTYVMSDPDTITTDTWDFTMTYGNYENTQIATAWAALADTDEVYLDSLAVRNSADSSLVALLTDSTSVTKIVSNLIPGKEYIWIITAGKSGVYRASTPDTLTTKNVEISPDGWTTGYRSLVMDLGRAMNTAQSWPVAGYNVTDFLIPTRNAYDSTMYYLAAPNTNITGYISNGDSATFEIWAGYKGTDETYRWFSRVDTLAVRGTSGTFDFGGITLGGPNAHLFLKAKSLDADTLRFRIRISRSLY